MAELNPEVGLYAQDYAIRAAATALSALLPPDGDHIKHCGFYLARLSGSVTVAIMPDGREVSLSSSPAVRNAFIELRRIMYKPGVGSWFSVMMMVWADGHMCTDFNFDKEPDGDATPPGGIAYISD